MQVKVAVEALEKKDGRPRLARSRSTASRTPPTTLHDEALRRLFEEEKDAITIIKWKEVLDLLEAGDRPLRGRAPTSSRASSSSTGSGRGARSAVVVLVIVVALVFDYINGFHDAANSIATVVSTRVLSPAKAVIWAAFFNFVAAFGFGTAVASTVGSGMIDICGS